MVSKVVVSSGHGRHPGVKRVYVEETEQEGGKFKVYEVAVMSFSH